MKRIATVLSTLTLAAALATPNAAQALVPTHDGTTHSSAVSSQAAEITWTLVRSDNPSADEQDAYGRITDAMNRAVARYNNLSDLTKQITVYYAPGVPTAEASNNGTMRFGSNRSFMSERTALHEISHTVGVGQNGGYYANIGEDSRWTGQNATSLLESFDGVGARLNTGGGHIWPYGLNQDNEWSETNADRHVRIVAAMVADGM